MRFRKVKIRLFGFRVASLGALAFVMMANFTDLTSANIRVDRV